MNTGAYAFYSKELQDNAGTKRCKPKDMQGCGLRKDLSEFRRKRRERVDGSWYWEYRGWCKKCQAARDRAANKKVYTKKRLPDIYYKWDESKQRFRIYLYGETVFTVRLEEEAVEAVKDLKARNKVADLFFRLPAPPLVYDADTDRMVPR